MGRLSYNSEIWCNPTEVDTIGDYATSPAHHCFNLIQMQNSPPHFWDRILLARQ